jgi:hypothetical protein
VERGVAIRVTVEARRARDLDSTERRVRCRARSVDIGREPVRISLPTAAVAAIAHPAGDGRTPSAGDRLEDPGHGDVDLVSIDLAPPSTTTIVPSSR